MQSRLLLRLAPDATIPGPHNRTWAIFLISVIGLFLELLLIRWIGTEVRIFAYLQNTVLIVCFLGLGVGCFTCRQPIVMRRVLLPLLALSLILTVPYARHLAGTITNLLSVLSDFLIWEEAVNNGLYSTIGRVVLGHMNARTCPAVGYLPVQKLRLSPGRRYSSDCGPGPVLPQRSLSITIIGDINP